jgi:hypothetical protein
MEQTLENVPFFTYLPQMKQILEHDQYKAKISHPDRVECILPEYNVIQYSKFGWINDTIQQNPYDSEYFFWMDIGGSRFFSGEDLSKPFPRSLDWLKKSEGKCIIQMRDDIHSFPIDSTFIWRADNLLNGSCFGGKKQVMTLIEREIIEVVKNEMFANNNINNEQLALALLWKKSPDTFCLVPYLKSHLSVFHLLSM